MASSEPSNRFGHVRDHLVDQDQDIIGTSLAGGLDNVMTRVRSVAPSGAPVLILGETGSGKEVIAGAVHRHSLRHQRAFVRVNCGAIPPTLLDSELFGHERGSFTGATDDRKGWFERADGGTLFLDEIGELALEAQVRLLRVLQEGSFQRVGGHRELRCDVRIIAATNRDLGAMVRERTFREDLWYRLTVFPIYLPPLRDRLQDLPELTRHFAQRAADKFGLAATIPSAEDDRLLAAYAWPGNVRELASVVERAALLGNGKTLEVAAALGISASFAHTTPASTPARVPSDGQSSPFLTLDEAMKQHIERALERCHGRVEGPHGAAKLLRINPHTLRSRMRKLSIAWLDFRAKA